MKVSDRSCTDLEYVLGSISAEHFLSKYCGRETFYSAGDATKYQALMSWKALNSILEHHQLVPSRLRVMREGRVVAPEMFTRTGSSRISVPALTAILRGGATIAIPKLDELHEPAGQLAHHLERGLEAPVSITLWTTFKKQFPVDPRLDETEAIRLQVAGRTHWQIYAPIEWRDPLNPGIFIPPGGEPKWEGELGEGDTLYVPHGSWYSWQPEGRDSIHLSIQFANPTTADLLRWIGDELKRSGTLSAMVPRFAEEREQLAYLSSFRSSLLDCLDGPSPLQRFRTQQRRQRPPRESLGLPWTTSETLTPLGDAWIEIVNARDVRVTALTDEEAIELEGYDGMIRLHAAATPLVSYLIEKSPLPMSEFIGTFRETFDEGQLREVLTYLADNRLLVMKERLPW